MSEKEHVAALVRAIDRNASEEEIKSLIRLVALGDPPGEPFDSLQALRMNGKLRNLLQLMVDRLELEGVTRAEVESMSGWDKEAADFLEWRE